MSMTNLPGETSGGQTAPHTNFIYSSTMNITPKEDSFFEYADFFLRYV